jgi:octaprenyl-diphosphate synthase
LNQLKNIQIPIKSELEMFNKTFQQSLRSHVPLLDKVMMYIVKSKGKQMRPMFVLLAAGVCGVINDATYRGASLIELLHTATLVHDDVVDDAYQRRNFWSINALWKNKIAVLVGDYLLSKGLLLAVDNGDFRLLQLVSIAVKVMSEGELLQIEKARKLDITEAIYFEIIKGKTASLIAAACGVGAASAGADETVIATMQKIGEYAGIAFQIKDDLFDYNDISIGKPTHIDIKEKKMTLPLIYTINNVDKSTKSWLINIIKNNSENKKLVNELIDVVKKTGGITYAQQQMELYLNKSLDLLKPLPDSNFKESLHNLIYYSIQREN